MTGQLRITGPGDLIDAVPHLLGFTPTESTVIVALTDNRVVTAARVDLDHGESAAADVLRQLLAHAERAVMIVYTERPAPQWVQQPTHLVSDALLVADGRWCSMLPTHPTCSAPDSDPHPGSPRQIHVVHTEPEITEPHARMIVFTWQLGEVTEHGHTGTAIAELVVSHHLDAKTFTASLRAGIRRPQTGTSYRYQLGQPAWHRSQPIVRYSRPRLLTYAARALAALREADPADIADVFERKDTNS